VQRRYDRHIQIRQQSHNVAARFATKYSKLVLQAHHVELSRVQELGCTVIVFELLVVDLQTDRGRIIVVPITIRHRHDGGVCGWARGRNCLLQVSCESGNSAATRKRIANESDPASGCQNRGLRGRLV
jgi:hypothetical protein